jgi:hypothetical protein
MDERFLGSLFASVGYSDGYSGVRSFALLPIPNGRRSIRERSAWNARADCAMRSRHANEETERSELCVNSNSAPKCRKRARAIREKQTARYVARSVRPRVKKTRERGSLPIKCDVN